MKIGFARTSTTKQIFGLENQVELLEKEGCDKIFHEQVSAVAKKRPEFEKAIEFAREGDALVVTTLSRLGRSLKNILDIKEQLQVKGVGLKILDLSLDTSTPTGNLTFNLLSSIYEFERQIMIERQSIGLAKTDKKLGRPSLDSSTKEKIAELHRDGMKPSEISRELGIGVASVYKFRNVA